MKSNTQVKHSAHKVTDDSVILLTRLPSNLRPTTRQWVHSVTCGQFWSRAKDGGHIIPSVIAKNPTIICKPYGSYFPCNGSYGRWSFILWE